jgi:alpha-beta hydrolase superfamily lysophospholipase
MQHNEGTFKGFDGLELYYQSWQPEGVARAVLAIVHGLGEHGGRYMNIVNYLVPKGYAIYALDHRGHGRSPGLRAFVNSWSEYIEDVGKFCQLIAEQQPAIPFFLMGHSMGGNITLNYILHNPTSHHPDGVKAVIASAPAVGKLDVPPVLAFISRLLSGILPKLSVATGLDATAVSRDTAVVQAYQNDPLVHGKGTPRFATEFAASADWSMAHAAEFTPPLLLIHGEADRLVNVQASRDFFARVPHNDKKLIIYEGGYHESHNDLEHERVVGDIENWLEAHM